MEQISINTGSGTLASGGHLNTKIRLAGRGSGWFRGLAALVGVVGPSPDNTVVVPGGPVPYITDNAMNRWTITSTGKVAENGLVDAITANVVELAWIKGVIWQLNTSGNWYSKTATSVLWSAATTVSPLSTVGTAAVLLGVGHELTNGVAVLNTGIVLLGRAFSDQFSTAFD